MDNTDELRLIDKVACIILAGGQGTRLFPLTKDRCKPAVSFGGRYRLIDVPISNSLNSKLTNIYVISQYFSSGLNQHIAETYKLDRFRGGNIELLNPQEKADSREWYEGTADAVRKNLEHLAKGSSEYFVILSGDQLYNMDLQDMVYFAKRHEADLTIAALPVTEEEAPRLGILKVDSQSVITDFAEKPQDPDVLKQYHLKADPPYLASMGIYIFKREALIKLLTEDDRHDFGKHLIPEMMKRGKTCAYIYKGYWEDIGTVESFYNANLALTTNSFGINLYNEVLPIYSQAHNLPGARITHTQLIDSIVCNGSVIEAKEITHSLIGVRSRIKRGTVIRDSIVMGHESCDEHTDDPQATSEYFEVGENCFIQRAIIDENSHVGNNVHLTNKDGLANYDGDGIYIRDGIIVVTSGTIIPDGFTL